MAKYNDKIMTKNKIYDKLYNMEKIKRRNLIKAVACLGLACLTLFCCSIIGEKNNLVNAATHDYLLPKTEIEYKDVTGASDFAYLNGNYAIIISNTIHFYGKDGSQKVFDNGYISLKQVRFLDEDTILFTDNGTIKAKKLSTEAETDIIGCNFFDLNSSYMVTVYSNNLLVYQLSDVVAKINGALSSIIPVSQQANANGDYPVTINSKNEVIYHSGSPVAKVYKIVIGSNSDMLHLSDVMAQNVAVSNDEYLFFIDNQHKIHKLTLADKTDVVLTTTADYEGYDLGNINTPLSLALKDGNLVVIDSVLNAITEFKVEGDKLTFTGFAIASGKTAFNRITKNAADVEVYGDTVAVLDANKLTVIKADGEFDSYSPDFFINLYLGGAPKYFALGNQTVLSVFNDGAIKLHGVTDGANLADVSGVADTVHDVCYQSGNYYILSAGGASAQIYKLNEKTFELSILLENLPRECKVITADVLGNIYFADSTNVYKNATDTIITAWAHNGTKLSTDLAGVIYAVIGGELNYYSGNGWMPCGVSGVKSFAMNFDKKAIYYVTQTDEKIYRNVSINNLAIDSFAPSAGFMANGADTDEQAFNGGKNLAFYTARTGANIYSVSYGEQGFSQDELAESRSEYIFLDRLSLTAADGNPLNLLVLAEEHGVVLVNEKDASLAQKEFTAYTQEKAYITTDVCLYKFPLITSENLFTAKLNGENIRLTKGAEIAPINEFTFDGRRFYSVKAMVAEQTVYGFIPADFTVSLLAQSVEAETITVNGDNDDDKKVVRNILIVLAVITSICGTASYFILRKKPTDD